MRRRPAQRSKRRLFPWLLLLLASVLVVFVAFVARETRNSVILTRNWRVTLAINTQPATLLSFPKNPVDRMLLVTFPPEAYVDVPWEYGPYRMEAVWRLAKLEGKPNLFQDALGDMLSIPVQGWVDIGQPALSEKPLEQLKQAVGLFTFPFTSGISNLNFLDRFLVAWQLTFASRDALLYDTAHNLYLFEDTQLADGTPVKQPRPEALTDFFEQKFEDSDIRNDGLSVRVLNTTEIAGVGSRFATLVSHVGGKVIAVGNEVGDVSTCTLETGEVAKDKKLVRLLRHEFGCELLVTEDLGVDIVVRVGSAFAERWQ